MFRNYFLIAVRSIFRHKTFAAINISGLVVGFTVSIFIFMYVLHEVGYDKFHDDSENIYRISVQGRASGQNFDFPVTPALLAKNITADFREVKTATRFKEAPESYFNYNNIEHHEKNLFYADSAFFDVFSFRFIHGTHSRHLDEPYTMVISESLSKIYFGNENPIGKALICNNSRAYRITGVFENVPDNSHFKFNALLSFPTLRYKPLGQFLESWTSLSYYTYLKLHDNIDISVFSKKISDYIHQKSEDNLEDFGIHFTLYLQSLHSIHLHSNLAVEIAPNSDIKYIYMLVIVAILIVLIACINFMNLSTARLSKRSKEVAVRKVLGSSRSMLFLQFIGESVLISLIALTISMVLVELTLPFFNALTERSLEFHIAKQPLLFFTFITLAVVTGCFAGSYPALYLSAFSPIRVFRGNINRKNRNHSLRGVLVFIQFAISTSLIICTAVIYYQIAYLTHKRLGFDREGILIVPIHSDPENLNLDLLKEKLSEVPQVVSVSGSNSVPGGGLLGNTYFPEGKSRNEPRLIYTFNIDYSFIETLNINVLSGRNFSPTKPSDTACVIINETLVKELKWTKPIGKSFSVPTNNSVEEIYKVIGVVSDFHNQSLHEKISPMLLHLNPHDCRFLSIKIKIQDIDFTLLQLKKQWASTTSGLPFNYYFIDKYFNEFYKEEQKQARIFVSFTLIAIIIALLGLFGMATFIAEQRTKEIGIRKVMGANAKNIMFILSKEFSKWVVLANLIAWPLAWVATNEWLKSFEYKIDFAFWIYLASSLFAFLVAILTTSSQAIKASRTNPIISLKYE